LVSNLGFPEWGVETPDAFVAKCRALASDLSGLAGLRLRLREQMRQSPLCDAPQFVGHLETALRDMWKHWCGQQLKKPKSSD
jgi:predicted O-linked N-acetylglucosamine transferase (SPINDLY family)